MVMLMTVTMTNSKLWVIKNNKDWVFIRCSLPAGLVHAMCHHAWLMSPILWKHRLIQWLLTGLLPVSQNNVKLSLEKHELNCKASVWENQQSFYLAFKSSQVRSSQVKSKLHDELKHAPEGRTVVIRRQRVKTCPWEKETLFVDNSIDPAWSKPVSMLYALSSLPVHPDQTQRSCFPQKVWSINL